MRRTRWQRRSAWVLALALLVACGRESATATADAAAAPAPVPEIAAVAPPAPPEPVADVAAATAPEPAAADGTVAAADAPAPEAPAPEVAPEAPAPEVAPEAPAPESAAATTKKPKGDIAVFVLDGRVVERRNPYAFFAVERELPLYDFVSAMDRLSAMRSVASIILRIGDFYPGFAQLQEMQRAVERARARGMRVIAHLQRGSEPAWLLASSADEIHLAPAADLMLDGVELGVVYLKGLLEKIGLSFDIEAIGRYKTGAEFLVRRGMSDEQREELGQLADTLYLVIVAGLTQRGLTQEAARAVIDAGPYPADEALRIGLVDSLVEWEALRDRLRDGVRGDMAVLYPEKRDGLDLSSFMGLFSLLSQRPDEPPRGRPKVAILYAVGPIMEGYDPEAELWGDEVVHGSPFVRAIDQLRDDESVKAVVLRIDSPGGSAFASDRIWQAVRRLRERVPVVASLGNVAASGGYYIASAADVIVVEPSTITGSIGVFGGKLVTAQLEGTLGIRAETVARGQNAGMFSPWRRFSETERARFQAVLQATYERFLERIAEGRGRPGTEFAPFAEGRVWTGGDAVLHGLADRIGGLGDALAIARERAGVAADLPAYAYPPHRSLIELLQEGPQVMGRGAPGWGMRAALARSLGVPADGLTSLVAGLRAIGLSDVVGAVHAAALLQNGAVLAHAPWVYTVR